MPDSGLSIEETNPFYSSKVKNMSRLLDLLQEISKETPAPIGFTAAKFRTKKPPLALIAQLPVDDPKLFEKAVASTDASLVKLEGLMGKEKAVKKAVGQSKPRPCGVRLENIQEDQISVLMDTGCDYLVFEVDATAAPVLNEDGIGKVLAVKPTIEENVARVLEDLAVDAILVESEGPGPVTVTHLVKYHAITSLLSKPVLVEVSLDISEGELRSLQGTAIDGVLVPVRDAKEAEKVLKLRELIESLPPRQAVAKAKYQALLPHSGIGPGIQTDTPDEEEDDE